MGKFEDKLLTELMQEHGPALTAAERPAPRRNTRPAWIAAGAIALAGAATAGLSLIGEGTPAFAVNQNPDGSVTVSIDDVGAIGPANKELERLGVPVRAVPAIPGCVVTVPTNPSATWVWPDIRNPDGQGRTGVSFRLNSDGGSITVPTKGLPAGTSIALGVWIQANGKVGTFTFAEIPSGAIPSCLPAGPDPDDIDQPSAPVPTT